MIPSIYVANKLALSKFWVVAHDSSESQAQQLATMTLKAEASRRAASPLRRQHDYRWNQTTMQAVHHHTHTTRRIPPFFLCARGSPVATRRQAWPDSGHISGTPCLCSPLAAPCLLRTTLNFIYSPHDVSASCQRDSAQILGIMNINSFYLFEGFLSFWPLKTVADLQTLQLFRPLL